MEGVNILKSSLPMGGSRRHVALMVVGGRVAQQEGDGQRQENVSGGVVIG